MILIPQYRTSRRAAGGGDITVIEEIGQQTSTGATLTFAFAGTPANGEKLVAVVCCVSAPPTTVPSGFSVVASHAATTERVYVYEKVAASESNSYAWLAGGSRYAVMMARLSSGTYDTSGANSGVAVSSLIVPAAGLAVPNNSYVVAGWRSSSSANVSSVNNSFMIEIATVGSRSCIATRKYTTGGASEQVTGTTGGSTNIGALMAVFSP